MNEHVDAGARSFGDASQGEMLARLDKDRAEMLAIIEDLDTDSWGSFIVSHKYMGPLPAFFYPVAQLVDYTVHTWDIRQGTGSSHAMDGDAADLLVPFCFIVWQSTADCAASNPSHSVFASPGTTGASTRVAVTPDGIALEPGAVDDLPLVLDFDPASFVLTAMGRINGGTALRRREPRRALLQPFLPHLTTSFPDAGAPAEDAARNAPPPGKRPWLLRAVRRVRGRTGQRGVHVGEHDGLARTQSARDLRPGRADRADSRPARSSAGRRRARTPCAACLGS